MVQYLFEQALHKHSCPMKAQTPQDDPSYAVPVSEPMHVKHEEILERNAVVCKTKGKKKDENIFQNIFRLVLY